MSIASAALEFGIYRDGDDNLDHEQATTRGPQPARRSAVANAFWKSVDAERLTNAIVA